MESTFFKTQSYFRKWLIQNHEKEDELWVGYYKKASNIPSITWPQSVDEALCFGWIDGLRRSIDENSYKIRFTPRRPKSHWSNINIDKMNKLMKQGVVHERGKKAYALMDVKNSAKASYEQKEVKLAKKYMEELKRNKKAWEFYKTLSPYIKRASNGYIMSAKKEETRLKRLRILIESSEKKLKIPQLRTYGK